MNCTACIRKAALAAIATATLAASAYAKTTTWTGGDTTAGTWTDDANWDNGAPATGDTAVIGNNVSFTKSFNIGASGVTISVAAGKEAKLRVQFAGAGTLVKTGPGTLSHESNNWGNFTGGVRIEEGTFSLAMSGSSGWSESLNGKTSSYLMGPGTITVTGTGMLSVSSYQSTVNTPVVITGFSGGVALKSNGACTWSSSITSDSDFTFQGAWEAFTLTGSISAPGRTVTFLGTTWETVWYNVNGTVDANVVIDVTKNTVHLQGKSPNPAHTLTVARADHLQMSGSAQWGGSLVLNGTKATLTGGMNLADTSAVNISGGGVMTIDTADYTVRSFTCNGTTNTSGVCTSANSGGTLAGAKKLTVDSSVKLWVGGATGAWSDSANWDVAVPSTGDTAVFANAVTLDAGDVDVGASGIALDCRADVNGRVRFTGSGKLVKKGPGKFTSGAKYGLTGGVRIEEGILLETMAGEGFNYMTDALGSGTIEITGTGQLAISAYMATNTQPIVVTAHDTSIPTIDNQGSTVYLGAVTADCDFTLRNAWNTPRFLNGISAPGHTVTYFVPSWNNIEWWYADSELAAIDASLAVDIKNGRPLVLSTAPGATGNSLTVSTGTVKFKTDAAWDAVSLANGAVVNVAQGVTVDCATLTVGGVAKDNGVYRASTLPGVVTGDGRVRVGGKTPFVIVVR